MVADTPEISHSRDCRRRTIDFGNYVFFVRLGAQLVDQEVDFGGLKASDGDVEIQLDGELLQFEREELPVPSGVFCKFVVGNDIGADLGRRQMIDAHSRDIAKADELRGFDPAMACDDAAGAVDQDRIEEPEFHDAGGDLFDLLCAVGSGVPRPRF